MLTRAMSKTCFARGLRGCGAKWQVLFQALTKFRHKLFLAGMSNHCATILQHAAHEQCFIANSIKTDVIVADAGAGH
jgi:hypothetical protein